MVTVMRPSSARVRKCNDTTPRARCPNSAAPGAGGARRALAWRRAASRADPRNPRRLPRFLDQRQRSRSFANDEDPGFLILSAVPMHLLAEMGDETAAGHGNHIVFVDFVAGCDPPRAFDHGDEAIVGMEMRLAEVAGLESIEDDVEPTLGRIALQDDLVGAGGAGRIAPLVLIGQSVDDGGGLEAREPTGGELDLSAGPGAIAEDHQRGILGLGPIPMHLFAEMGDESAGR